MTAKFMVNIVFTVLLAKCPAQETGEPMSGWIRDVLSRSKNAEWDTGESISSLKEFRAEVMLDCSTFNSLN